MIKYQKNNFFMTHFLTDPVKPYQKALKVPLIDIITCQNKRIFES